MIEMGVLFGIIALFGWGVLDFLAAIIVKKISVFKVVFWKTAVSLLLITSVAIPLTDMLSIDLNMLFWASATAIFEMIGVIAFYKGFQEGKISIIAPISNAWPIVTITIALLFLKENLTLLQGIMISCLIIGTILTSIEIKRSAYKGLSAGVGYAVTALFTFGIYLALLDVLMEKAGWILGIFLIHIVSISILGGYALIKRVNIRDAKGLTRGLLAMGVLEFVAFITYGIAISMEHSVIIAPIVGALPAVTVLLAHTILDEKIYLNQYFGIFIVLISIVLLSIHP